MNKVSMDKWFRGVFYRNPSGKPCRKLILRHAGQRGDGKGGHLIQEWEIDGKIDDDLIQQLMSEIENCSRDDAEGIGGRQRYIIFAYRDTDDEPLRFPFPMTGMDRVGDDGDSSYIEGFESEGATATGLMSQLMRHNEVLMRANVGSMGTILNVQNRMLARLGDMCENLMSAKMQNLELHEEVISRNHERTIEVKQLEGKQKLQDEAIEAFKLLIPVAMNRLAGKSVLPEKSPILIMMKQLAESLTPQQVQVLMGTLKPEQQAVLLEFMQATQEKQPGL